MIKCTVTGDYWVGTGWTPVQEHASVADDADDDLKIKAQRDAVRRLARTYPGVRNLRASDWTETTPTKAKRKTDQPEKRDDEDDAR
jgi:hypothetical protein